jgi:predicted AAA+ superfamily ATPase
MAYRQRIADGLLDEYLGTFGGVLIEGPRGCGKTATGSHHAASAVRLDQSAQLVELASLNPRGILAGASPRLVDEWQLAPSLWNVIRHEIDDRQERGQFIMCGSASPNDDTTRHSGAGRVGRLRMRTMSLHESGHSTGTVSLAGLAALGGTSGVDGRSRLSYLDLAARAVCGGWPALLDASDRQAMLFNRSYLDDLCASDIQLASGVHHDPRRMRRLLESVARNTASESTLANLAGDVSADGGSVTPETARTYLDALSRVFAYDELSAWSVHLRSRSRPRTSPKHMLADPALSCALLGVGVDRLAADPEFFGQVFEAMAVRDLRVYAGAALGQVYHYRDNTGLEVDAIIEYPDKNWGAIEVKLGATRVRDAEANLIKLRDERVETAIAGKPIFLAVITGTEYAYTLPSGVHVIPLATLSP